MEVQPNDIFAWNPPALVPPPRKSTTKKTRPPAFFDKHLRDHLILKYVKRFPNLAKEIASVVDSANLPPTDGLRNGDALHMVVSQKDIQMVNEEDVADFYAATAATYLVPVASVLALSPKVDVSYRKSLLSFTKSSALSCAIAGFLRWRADGPGNFHECLGKMVESMDEQTRLLYYHRDEYPTLATWEVKSIPVGEERVMLAIPRLGSFNWTKCRAVDCLQDPKHLRYREMVDKIAQDDKQRIDASKPPWELNFASPAPQVPTKRSSQIEAGREALMSMSASALPSGSGSSMKKRKQKSDQGAEIKKKQKQKRKGENEDDEDDEDKDESFEDPQEMTAHDIIQQAWAQAVRENTTLVIIHSGNHELVCVRHRQSQTLYVSDVIEPAKCRDPAYGKLHVGIYMAALEDVKDRFLLRVGSQSQLSEDSQGLPGNGNEEQGRKDDRREGSSKRGSGGNGGSGNLPKDNLGKRGDSGSSTWGQKRATDVHGNGARETTIEQAAHKNTLVMYLRYGIYDSPNPATFFRSAPSIFPVVQNPTPPSSPGKFKPIRLDDCLTVLLTSEIGRGATGVVLGGILEVEGSDIGIVLDIAVKLALTLEQREALSREYDFYKTLNEKGTKGIATTLGLFEDFEGGASALVMLHGGESLAARAKSVTISEREAFLEALASIHSAGIAHGDIRSPNFLINSSGEVTIIDFDQSIPTDSKKAKRREVQLLCRLLDGKEDD